MPEPLTSNDLIRAAEFAAVMEHAASREPLTDAVLAEITDRLLEVVPGSHWLSVHSLLAEVRRLHGYTSGFVLEGYRKGYADGLEAAANAGQMATLPEGYQWGSEAMEHFNFGKKRAVAAIRKLGEKHGQS